MEQRISRNGRVFISADGEHFEPLGELKDVELSLNPCDPSPEEEYRAYFSKECTITLEGKIEYGFRLFLLTEKKLFLKCPKKIRRSRKWRKFKNI